MGKDFIPRPDVQFTLWITTLIAYLTEARRVLWGIPVESYTEFASLRDAYSLAFTKYGDPNHGKSDTLLKNETRKSLESFARQFIRSYLTYNPKVTDVDRSNMGLPIHDTKHTPAPEIKDRPVIEIDFSSHQRHTLHVKMGTLSGTKPEHAYGFEVWRKIGEPAPAADGDWSLVTISTHSHLEIDYPQERVGTRVYYRARWINTRHLPGPWSEDIQSAIIA